MPLLYLFLISLSRSALVRPAALIVPINGNDRRPEGTHYVVASEIWLPIDNHINSITGSDQGRSRRRRARRRRGSRHRLNDDRSEIRVATAEHKRDRKASGKVGPPANSGRHFIAPKPQVLRRSAKDQHGVAQHINAWRRGASAILRLSGAKSCDRLATVCKKVTAATAFRGTIQGAIQPPCQPDPVFLDRRGAIDVHESMSDSSRPACRIRSSDYSPTMSGRLANSAATPTFGRSRIVRPR